ncbi:hypothetical protein ACFL09_05255 [Planctomycetota bacterium]
MTSGAAMGGVAGILVLSAVVLYGLIRGNGVAWQWTRWDVVLGASGLPAILLIDWLTARLAISDPFEFGLASLVVAVFWAPLVALGAEGAWECLQLNRKDHTRDGIQAA